MQTRHISFSANGRFFFPGAWNPEGGQMKGIPSEMEKKVQESPRQRAEKLFGQTSCIIPLIRALSRFNSRYYANISPYAGCQPTRFVTSCHYARNVGRPTNATDSFFYGAD